MKELGDRAAQGRAYGNLGNTHYLLGNFTEATTFHKEVSWAWVLGQGQESLRSPLTVLNSMAPGEPLSPCFYCIGPVVPLYSPGHSDIKLALSGEASLTVFLGCRAL